MEGVPTLVFELPPGGHEAVVQQDIRTWPRANERRGGAALDFDHAVDAYAVPGETLVVTCEPAMTILIHEEEDE